MEGVAFNLTNSSILVRDSALPAQLQLGVIGATVLTIILAWLNIPRIKDDHTRKSLAVYHVSNVITMIQGNICIRQIGGEALYTSNAICYGLTLATSYLFFFAKQKSVTRNTMMFLPNKSLHQFIEKLFWLAWIGYVTFVFAFSVLPVNSVDPETQKVSYAMPIYLRVLIALGDTGISLICLALFTMPLIAMSKVAAEQDYVVNSGDSEDCDNHDGNSVRHKIIRQVALRNSQMACIAIISTSLFMIAGSWIESDYWIVAGCSDLLCNVICISFMFPRRIRMSKGVTATTGQHLHKHY